MTTLVLKTAESLGRGLDARQDQGEDDAGGNDREWDLAGNKGEDRDEQNDKSNL